MCVWVQLFGYRYASCRHANTNHEYQHRLGIFVRSNRKKAKKQYTRRNGERFSISHFFSFETKSTFYEQLLFFSVASQQPITIEPTRKTPFRVTTNFSRKCKCLTFEVRQIQANTHSPIDRSTLTHTKQPEKNPIAWSLTFAPCFIWLMSANRSYRIVSGHRVN